MDRGVSAFLETNSPGPVNSRMSRSTTLNLATVGAGANSPASGANSPTWSFPFRPRSALTRIMRLGKPNSCDNILQPRESKPSPELYKTQNSRSVNNILSYDKSDSPLVTRPGSSSPSFQYFQPENFVTKTSGNSSERSRNDSVRDSFEGRARDDKILVSSSTLSRKSMGTVYSSPVSLQLRKGPTSPCRSSPLSRPVSSPLSRQGIPPDPPPARQFHGTAIKETVLVHTDPEKQFLRCSPLANRGTSEPEGFHIQVLSDKGPSLTRGTLDKGSSSNRESPEKSFLSNRGTPEKSFLSNRGTPEKNFSVTRGTLEFGSCPVRGTPEKSSFSPRATRDLGSLGFCSNRVTPEKGSLGSFSPHRTPDKGSYSLCGTPEKISLLSRGSETGANMLRENLEPCRPRTVCPLGANPPALNLPTPPSSAPTAKKTLISAPPPPSARQFNPPPRFCSESNVAELGGGCSSSESTPRRVQAARSRLRPRRRLELQLRRNPSSASKLQRHPSSSSSSCVSSWESLDSMASSQG